MTDVQIKENDENNFSFRMFDLYRRFVEILRQNSDYLMEFKSGDPSKAVCLEVIKKVFQYQQNNDSIVKYLKYLKTNAKIIADHAENLPHNWTDAIKYTNHCIKLIRRYLRAESIDYKKDFDVDGLAEKVSEYLFVNPNQVQLEAVIDYLKYDLRNPKRNTMPSDKPSKKSQKKSKTKERSQNLDVNDSIEVALKVIFNENQDSLKQNMDTEKNIQSTLHKENVNSQNNQKTNVAENIFVDNLNEKYSLGNEFINIEDVDEIESPPFENLENFIDDFNEIEFPCNRLKRLSHDVIDDHENVYTKKICILEGSDQQELQKDLIQPTTYNKVDKLFVDKISSLHVNVSKCNTINVDVQKANIVQANSSKEDLLNILDDPKVKKNENNILLDSDKRILSLKENICSDEEQTYFNPKNMTYLDAYKLMESIISFAVLRNEIPFEELIILRRTRDKMLWRCLKDVKIDK